MYTATQQAFWHEPVAGPAGSDEAYTPAWLVEAAREVLGGIDLDPASCAKAQTVVQAGMWYGEQHDGLAQHWQGRMWLNPPYSDPDPWVEKALAHWLVGDVIQALLLVRSDPSTEYSRMLGHSPALLCMLKRVDFLAAADEPEDRQAIITQLSGAALVSRR